MEPLLQWIVAPASLPFLLMACTSFWGVKYLKSAAARWRPIETWLVAHRYLVLGVFALGLHAFLSLVVHWPEPRVHDEYSYLLAADTFAQGRLTNPAPPLPVHFESFHIFVSPTYMSKYPPAQGMSLAIGKIFFGEPIVGAWLTAALAVVVMAWALSPIVGARWAFLTGVVAAVHPLLLAWGQSYWGGSVALLGAALLFGSLYRWVAWPSLRYGGMASAGVALLANSRPYEGVLFCLLSFGSFTWTLIAKRIHVRIVWRQFLRSFLPILVLVFCWMAYYNYRLTGDWKTLPYQLHASQYNAAPQFVWMAPSALPQYSRRDLRELHAGYERFEYESQQGTSKFFHWKAQKALVLFQELFQSRSVLIAVIGALLLAWSSSRFYLFAIGLFLVGMAPVTYFNLHYFAPLIVFGSVLLALGLKALTERAWKGREPARVFMTLVFGWLVGPGLVWQAIAYSRAQAHVDPRFFSWQAVEAPLRAAEGKHLLLLPCETTNCAVVHNEADLSEAKIVRARALGEVENTALFTLFPERSRWVLVRERDVFRVRPLSAATRPLHSQNLFLSNP